MENTQQDLSMVDFNTNNVLDDLNQVVPGTVVALHNNMIKALWKVYPQWKDYWHITIDTRGGIVQVRNLAISGDMGFVLHIADIDPEMKKVRTEAGELLERFNVARNKGMAINRAMADVKSDGIGRLTYEK
mgnify:CR=1 FL=1